jgi:hypothetical protein
MCSVIGQRDGDQVNILAEVVLPESNTFAACEAFVKRTGPWLSVNRLRVQLDVYEDASGGDRRTSASRPDWQIVKEALDRTRRRVTYHVPKSNPP